MRHRIALSTLLSVVTLATADVASAQGGRPSATLRSDAFSKVHCGGDVSKVLVGGNIPNGPVAALEAAHADIKLKNVGGSSIDDTVFLGGWQVCGQEVQLLTHRDRVDDALRFPPHSRRQPAFLGACTLHDRRVENVLAVLDNPSPRAKGQPPYSPDDTTSLAGVAAWRVDGKSRRIVGISTSGLRCPRGGISTVDGGT